MMKHADIPVMRREMEELKKIFSPLAGIADIRVFVHGSWADSTRTAFSDLDDFIILDPGASKGCRKEIEEKLNEVELTFQRLDPLQHHGHWIISTNDLRNYDNSYIPLFILERALLIYGNRTIDAHVDPVRTKEGLIKNIKRTCEDIENLYRLHEKGMLNLYKLKGWVGSFALLPALVFQLKGFHIDKREAIGRSADIFDEDSRQLIQWATDIRNHWAILLKDDKYKAFAAKISDYNLAKEWRDYARENAPILNYEDLSLVKIRKNMIDKIVGQALGYVDEQKFKRLQSDHYRSAYQHVEAIAWNHGAIASGHFGEVRHPSISDLDVFICFPDEKYKAGVQAVDRFISEDETLAYIFTHPPLYVAASTLPIIKYLHTLYGLTITRSEDAFSYDSQLTPEYARFFSGIWTLFLLRIVSNQKKNLAYYDTRYLLLLTKNIHTSIYNLERMMGRNSDVLEKSRSAREEILHHGIRNRTVVEETFKEAVAALKDTLKQMSTGTKPCKRSLMITRSLLFYLSDEYKIEKAGTKTIYYLDSYLFNIAYRLYARKGEEALRYLKALSGMDAFATKHAVKNPVFYPFHMSPLNSSGPRRFPISWIKGVGIQMLNLLPASLKIAVFKRI